ncbi:MAG: HNH endonuclease [Actinomycetota bacterium]|nr:HNH endonuclease [Actinomycetota bacterium]
MDLGALGALIDELTALDPAVLADPQSVVDLHRCIDRLQAISTRAMGAFEAGGAWRLDGARSPAGWVMAHCRLPKPAAKAEVALARSLRHLPVCEAAWLDGDIGLAHVRTLARARRPATQDQLTEDEEILVGHAKVLPFRHFAKVVNYWTQQADEEGEDQKAEDQHEQRRCHLSQSLDGLWFLDGLLDPIAGTVLSDELSRLEDELFKTEWADARARLGREPTAGELARTPQQRRADALVEMAVRSRTAPADGRRPEPLFTVLVSWETLKGRICELVNGTVAAPGALVPWLASAWIERVVFGARSRVIDVGVAQRLFKGATRRAVEDQECFHPTCDAPASRCQVDHIIPYSANGPTTQVNGRLACGFHNRGREHAPPAGDPP